MKGFIKHRILLPALITALDLALPTTNMKLIFHEFLRPRSRFRIGWLLALVLALGLPAGVQAQFIFTTNNGAITITGYTGTAPGALIIPDSTNGFPVTSIAVNALFGNASLTSITIGTNVTSIGLDAFAYCYKLTAITVDTNNPAYSSVAGVLFNKGQTTLIEYPAASAETSYTIAASVTNLGDYAFGASTNLTSITIPNGVTSIGENAFNYCTSLTSLTIPYGVTSIATNTFITCFSLVSVTIPDSVTNIGYAAFYECGKLAGITLPDSVVSLGTLAFASCGLTNVTIPGSVTSVEQYAFASCASLTNMCFEGNAPDFGSQVFIDDPLPAIFYVSGATGWGANYDGIPIEVCAQCVEVGALQIIINPICAVENGAEWQVDGGAWQTSGAVVTNLAVGYHTVAFTNIVGWLTPGSQMVPVTANSTNTVAGNYIEGSTPGLITWINIGGPDQHWSTPGNWDLDRAPTTNDIVLIPNTGGSTCLMDVGATVAGLAIGDCAGGGSDGLELNGQTLEVTGLVTIRSNALFTVDSGILMGASNTVISGVLGWTSGGLAGTLTLASNSVLNISGNAGGQYFSSCLFTNNGTVNWSDDPLSANGSVVIDNYGVWNAQDDRYFYGPNVVFNNYGTFRKSGGVGGYPGTYFNSGAVFNQLAGVLDVQSGTNGLWLSLTSGGSFTGGYVTTNFNGITYLGGGNFNINGTLTSSNVLFAGTYLVGTNVINGGLAWINGWWNGLVIVNTNSVVSIYAATYGKTFNGLVMNYGTVNWSADQLNANGGAVIDNYGVWNAQDNRYFDGSGLVFNNYGTFVKTGGASGYPGTYFNGPAFNQAGGTLSVQTGDVTLGGTYSLTNGTLNFGINNLTNNGVLLLGGLTLGGALSATVSGSFAPAVGDQFGVIGSSALSGTFNSVNLPAGIVVSYVNNTVFLNVTGPVPVQILSPQPVGTNFQFQFPTASNQSYTIQQNYNLATTNWVYYTNILGSGSTFQFQTPVVATPTQSFFRVRQP